MPGAHSGLLEVCWGSGRWLRTEHVSLPSTSLSRAEAGDWARSGHWGGCM